MEYRGVAWMIMDYRRLLWDYYVFWIIMDYGRSCIIPDYRALLWIIMTIMDSHELSRVIMDCYGLSWNMHYRLLSWIMDYPALSQLIMNYYGLL